MQPHRILDCVVTADGRELVLSRQGDVFHIHIDRYELMASRAHGPRRAGALALEALQRSQPEAGAARAGGRPGMGFNRARGARALADQPQAAIDVAEVFPAWWRGTAALAALARHPLADPRVSVLEPTWRRPAAAAGAMTRCCSTSTTAPRR